MPTDREKMRTVVVREVSAKIGVLLTFFADDDDDIICTDSKRLSYAIVGYHWPNKGFLVRGVVRNHRRGGRYSWLPNGQVGNHGKQIAWWEESGENSFIIPNGEFWSAAWSEDGGSGVNPNAFPS